MSGWDPAKLQAAIDKCTSPTSGTIQECNVLNGNLNDNPAGDCHVTPAVNEVVLGSLPKLPGCNSITAVTGFHNSCPNAKVPALFTKPRAYYGDMAPPGAQVVAGTTKVIMQYSNWRYVGW